MTSLPDLGQFKGIALGREGTWGTAVSTTVALEVLSCTSSMDKERAIVEESMRHTDTWSVGARTAEGIENVTGSLEIVPQYANGTMLLMAAAMGAIADTGPSGGNYTHTFTLADSPPAALRGLTIEHATGRLAAGTTCNGFVIEGCKVSMLEWSCDSKSEAKMKVDFVAETKGDTVSTLDFTGKWQSAAAAPIKHSHLSSAQVNILGTNYAVVRSVKFKIDNAITLRPNQGSDYTSVPSHGRRKITATIVLERTDDTAALVEAYKNGTQGTVSFTYASGAKSFAVSLTNCKIMAAVVPDGASPVQLQTIELEAMNDHSTSPLTVTMINTVALYNSPG